MGAPPAPDAATPSPAPCARCALRARQVRDAATYDKTICAACPVCPVCLGVLQDATLTAVTSTLSAKLRTIAHDNQLKITASLPPAIGILRERAFAQSLAAGYYPLLQPTVATVPTSGPVPPPVPLREALKLTLSTRVHRLLGLAYAADAAVFLDLVFCHTPSDADAQRFASLQPAAKSRRLRSGDRESTTRLTKVVEAMPDADFARAVPHLLPLRAPSPVDLHADADADADSGVSVESTVSTEAVYFAGRYNKWSRAVSQTPWFVDAPGDDKSGAHDGNRSAAAASAGNVDAFGRAKRTKLSVEDAIVPGLRAALRADRVTFTAGGREDVDVRMLGTGRPFLLEVVNPNTTASHIPKPLLDALMRGADAHTASRVSISGLRVVDRSFAARVKHAETDKRKTYRAVIWTGAPRSLQEMQRVLEKVGGFVLQQRTPLRVLHRRTQLRRERRIFRVQVVRDVTERTFVVEMSAQAGTYIKEFVHGDRGRTVPNVAALVGCYVDILQLDVVAVELDGEGGDNEGDEEAMDR